MKNIIGALFVVILVVVWFFLGESVAISIDGKYDFSNNDIDNLYDTEMKLADIVGSSVVKSKNDVLYNLAITSMQKVILEKNSINLDKEKSIKFIEENNNFKGFYQQARKKLGDNDYYRLLIEPVAISRTFLSFYNSFEPARVNALKILAAAKDKSLAEIAKLINKSLSTIEIDMKKQENIAKELIKLKKNKNLVYNHPIKINNNLAVLEFKSANKDFVKVNALVFKIMSYKEFLSQLLKEIRLDFPILSKYNMQDIHNKEGSVIQ